MGADTPIGLLTDRGTGMAVGALGILKAGAAYVPIDSTFPRERIAFILADTAAPAVVTREAFREQLADYSGHVITIDSERKKKNDGENDDPAVSPVSGTSVMSGRRISHTSSTPQAPPAYRKG